MGNMCTAALYTRVKYRTLQLCIAARAYRSIRSSVYVWKSDLRSQYGNLSSLQSFPTAPHTGRRSRSSRNTRLTVLSARTLTSWTRAHLCSAPCRFRSICRGAGCLSPQTPRVRWCRLGTLDRLDVTARQARGERDPGVGGARELDPRRLLGPRLVRIGVNAWSSSGPHSDTHFVYLSRW